MNVKVQSAVVLSCLWLSAAAFAADNLVTVEATGEAAIHGGDVVQARDKALADALRNAVEKAVGTVVTSSSTMKDFELVEDKVLSNSRGYVKKYDIKDKKEADGVVTITLTAQIGKDELAKDVDALLQLISQKGKPKILIMVAEQNVGQATAAAWWTNQGFTTNLDVVENTFIDQWQPIGFSFVDPQALKGKIKVSKAMQSAAVEDKDAKEFAGKAGAQVVIVGKAVAQEVGNKVFGTNMVSARANLSVRAIRTDTGDILATSTMDAGSMALDATTAGSNAFKESTKKMAEELKGKIMRKWLEEVNSGQAIKLVVNNVKKTAFLKTLKSTLTEQIRGVSAVRDRGFKNKVAEFELDMKGSAQDLAIELEAKNFADFKVEVDEVTANALEITLK
ncbi:MAG: flagellar assembly protein T N-terminal domain-containing protein [Deltaproteobacteria bacterium]|nr:flagellar assembly protein T N-terminal domain-containing protein [Deltaproteobacteria bacterium]